MENIYHSQNEIVVEGQEVGHSNLWDLDLDGVAFVATHFK